jgi:hydrogenase expression/formation protein HypE
MAKTAKESDIGIVTGDTKVVGRGEADGLFINTSGIGIIPDAMNASCRNAKIGDSVIVSGEIGEHGMAILNAREKLGLESKIKSDVACVYPLVKSCLSLSKYIHTMRDPTRGGLVSVLNEISKASQVGIKIYEKNIPLKKEVARGCELLGLDCLNMANEGKVIFFVDSTKAKGVLSKLNKNALGRKAKIIGEVVKGSQVYLETKLGAKRLLPLLEGEALPRIC